MEPLILCGIPGLCIAQTIDIRGTVKGPSGETVPNAKVELERAGVSMMTDENGGFVLTDGFRLDAKHRNTTMLNGTAVSFDCSGISLSLKHGSKVVLEIYDASGRKFISKERVKASGSHRIPLPRLSAGAYQFVIGLGTDRKVSSCMLFDTKKRLAAVSRGFCFTGGFPDAVLKFFIL